MTRPNALFLAHVLPSTSGWGMAMRMGHFLDALRADHDITLVVLTDDHEARAEDVPEGLRQKCAQCHLVKLHPDAEARARTRAGNTPLRRLLSMDPAMLRQRPLDEVPAQLGALRGAQFDLVFLARLQQVSAWRVLRDQLQVKAGKVIFDLDDIESLAQERKTRLLGPARLGKVHYKLEMLEVSKLARAQERARKDVTRVVVCSQIDKQKLLGMGWREDSIAVVPNCITLPEMLPPRKPDGTLRALFVGALDYVPNDDAVRWFTDEIQPKVPNLTFVVVGRNPPQWMKAMAQAGKIELHENVPDVAPYYAGADVSVVPLRAGGGTRIKILESFGYGRPVVSTAIGAEGLEVSNEKDILIANTAEAIATKLSQLAQSAEVGNRLVIGALETAREKYSQRAFAKCVMAI